MSVRVAHLGLLRRSVSAFVLAAVITTLAAAHCATASSEPATASSSAGVDHSQHAQHAARSASESSSAPLDDTDEHRAPAHHRSLACAASLGCAGTISNASRTLAGPQGTGRLATSAHDFEARDADRPEPPVPRSPRDI